VATRDPDDPRCKDCSEERLPGKSRCAACAERHREQAAKRRETLRKLDKCVVCSRKVAKGRRYCKRHLAYYREHWRQQAATK
jgi:hypothetical protein